MILRHRPLLLTWAAYLAGSSIVAAPLTAQCRPAPAGLVVLWDADDIYYVPWHHTSVYGLNIVDRIAGPPLVVDIANQSTAQWRDYMVSAVDGRTALRLDNWDGTPYLQAADHPTLDFTNSMSVEMWFRSFPGSPLGTGYHNLLAKGGDYYGEYDSGYYLLLEPGRVYFNVGQGTGRYTNPYVGALVDVLDGTWHHIVGTFDFAPAAGSGTMKVFVDGVLHGTRAVSLPIVPNDNMLVVGRGFGGGLLGTNGWYDEIALYDRALTDQEVADAFQAGTTTMCRPAFPDRRWFDSVVIPLRTGVMARGADAAGNIFAVSQQTNGADSGVSVYTRPGPASPWTSETTLIHPDETPFGAVQISGDTVAAVAGGFAPGVSIQRVFAWRRMANSTWVNETASSDPKLRGHGFRSIALAGDLLAAGMDDWYQNGQDEEVRIFRRSGSTWTFEQDVTKPFGTGPGAYGSGGGVEFVEELGYALAIRPGDTTVQRPDRIFIAEPGKYDAGVHAGAVHVYEYQSGTWIRVRTITPDLVEANLSSYAEFRFGSHLVVDGDRLLVAAPGHAVYVLDITATGFTVNGILRPLPGDVAFASENILQPIAVEGDLVAVAVGGAAKQGVADTAGYASAGQEAAHVYARRAGAWTLVSKLRHGYAYEYPFFQALTFDEGDLLSVDLQSRVVRHSRLRDALTSGLDIDPPVVSIASPQNGDVFGTSGVPLLGNVTDESSTTVMSSPAGVDASLPAGGGPVSGTVPLAAEGENTLTLTATDAAGNVGGNSVTVIRDTTRPAIDVPSPAEGTILGATPATFTVHVTDLTATTLEFGANTIPLPEGGGVATGPVQLVSGSNTVTFRATDAAGNVRDDVVRTVILDLDAPLVVIDTPVDHACFGPNESPVAVVATVTDLTQTDVGSLPAGVAGSLPAGGGQITGAVALQEGYNTIKVSAEDQTHRVGEGSIVVVLDTTPPAVTIASPATNAALRGVIDFDATAFDPLPGSGVASVEFAVDGNVVATVTGAPFESTLDTTLLTNGPHTLAATAIDGKGNRSLPPATVPVRVDNAPPVVVITQPAPNAVVAGTVAFAALVTDADSGAAALTMRVAGVAPVPGDGTTTFVPAVASGTGTSQVDTTRFADGPLLCAVEAIDAAGNTAATSVTVEVDNQAPDRTLLAPADGAVVHGTIDIVAAAQDPHLALLEILVDGIVVGSSASSPLTVPFDTTTKSDGSMSITVRATDTAGNRSTSSASVTVDNIGSGTACCDLHPETLNLKSKGGDKSVTLKVEGTGLERLVPTESHGWELRVPGGSPVPSTAGFAGDDVLVDEDFDTLPELTVKFDRQLLVASIRAGLAAGRIQPNSVLVVEIWADGRKICQDTMRIVH